MQDSHASSKNALALSAGSEERRTTLGRSAAVGLVALAALSMLGNGDLPPDPPIGGQAGRDGGI